MLNASLQLIFLHKLWQTFGAHSHKAHIVLVIKLCQLHLHKVRSGSRCLLNRSLTCPPSPRLYDGPFQIFSLCKADVSTHLPHVPRRPESRNACVCLSKTREDPENHIMNDVQRNTKKLTKNRKSGGLWEMTIQGVLHRISGFQIYCPRPTAAKRSDNLLSRLGVFFSSAREIC